MSNQPKIVFLDIDGVLNSKQWRIACFNLGYETSGTRLEALDPWAVQLLNNLTERTGASIVISSVWRASGLEQVTKLLRTAGATADIIGVTPDLINSKPGSVRGNEIQAWIDDQAQKPYSFVILDDDSDMVHLMDRLVKINKDDGLTQENVEQAIKILRNEA